MLSEYWVPLVPDSERLTMARKIVFALLLTLQFAVVSNVASASIPLPCIPCAR